MKKTAKTANVDVKQFKTNYYDIQASFKHIKKLLRNIKKEIKPVAKAAHQLYNRGDKTMYNEGKGGVITPKFNGLSRMMEDLEFWMSLDDEIEHTIECI